MSRRRDYSIPDCPKIGRYDGLGMAAVPLAIADKERELGINRSSSYSYEDDSKEYEKDLNDTYDSAYKKGEKRGYEKGLKDGRLEVYKKFMDASMNDTLRDLEIEADTFLICHCPGYIK